jgi:hypothetical protein
MSKYNGFEMLEWMEMLQAILQRSRPWHRREQRQTDWKMHPAVIAAVAVCRPADWKGMVLEWPHIADDDKRQIAYTRDERKGEENRQTMTSVGKYLKRQFPTMSDHVLRDITALHTPHNVEFKFLRTTPEMLHAIDTGPYSCMCSRYSGGSNDRWTHPQSVTYGHHPYEVYDPELGWHMAVAMEGDEVTGRALCMDKYYVRTYKAQGEHGSTTDERLDAWLQNQGYDKQRSWEYDTLFKHIPLQRRYFVAPYIDGNQYHVVIDTRGYLRLIDPNDLDNGDKYYECRNTSGTPTQETCNTGTAQCEDCDDWIDENDARSVGVSEDRCVCENCRDNNYTWAYTYRGRERYIPSDNVIYVSDNYYDTDYLSENNIVELADGDYAHTDDAVYIERLDEYHPIDDCVHCEHSNEYEIANDCVQLHDLEWAHMDDCWQCEHSGAYYLDDDAGIRYETECGKLVHIDYADEYAPETTEGE